MSGNITRRVGSWIQLMSSELNSLPNTSAALQASGTNPLFDNTQAGNLYQKANFEFDCAYGSNTPTQGDTCDLYLIPLSHDGVNLVQNTGMPVPNPDHYATSFYLQATGINQQITQTDVDIPGEPFVTMLVNNAGVAMPASGSTLWMRPQGRAYT